jgi:hypothetical protein
VVEAARAGRESAGSRASDLSGADENRSGGLSARPISLGVIENALVGQAQDRAFAAHLF